MDAISVPEIILIQIVTATVVGRHIAYYQAMFMPQKVVTSLDSINKTLKQEFDIPL